MGNTEGIYNIAQFEHLNVTFLETETILDGGKLLGLDDYEINVILNLKRACEWISFAIPNQLSWDANKRTAF